MPSQFDMCPARNLSPSFLPIACTLAERTLLGLDSVENSRSQGSTWIPVAGWVVLALADSNVLDFSVHHMHSPTLATSNDSNRWRSRVGHLHVDSLGELSCRITHEADKCVFVNALVFRPSIHDGAIVDTIDDDFIHARGLEILRFLKVPRDLLVGSRGSEGSRKTYDNEVLSLGVVSHVNELRKESLVEFDRRNRIAYSDVASSLATSNKGSWGESCY